MKQRLWQHLWLECYSIAYVISVNYACNKQIPIFSRCPTKHGKPHCAIYHVNTIFCTKMSVMTSSLTPFCVRKDWLKCVSTPLFSMVCLQFLQAIPTLLTCRIGSIILCGCVIGVESKALYLLVNYTSITECHLWFAETHINHEWTHEMTTMHHTMILCIIMFF